MMPSDASTEREAATARILDLFEAERQVHAQLLTQWVMLHAAGAQPQGPTRARIALLWEQHMRRTEELDRLIGAALDGAHRGR